MARVNAWRCDREGCKTEQMATPTIWTGTGGTTNAAPMWNGATYYPTPLAAPQADEPPQGWVTIAMTEGGQKFVKHFCCRQCAALFMYPYVPLDKRVNSAHESSYERKDEPDSEAAKWRERNAAKLAQRNGNK